MIFTFGVFHSLHIVLTIIFSICNMSSINHKLELYNLILIVEITIGLLNLLFGLYSTLCLYSFRLEVVEEQVQHQALDQAGHGGEPEATVAGGRGDWGSYVV